MRNILSEVEVANLLEAACQDSSDKIEFGYRVKNGHIADAFTKTGIAKLQILPNTLIEIKNRLLPDTLYQVRAINFDGNILIILINEEKHNETYGSITIKTFKELKNLAKNILNNRTNISITRYSVIEEAQANFNKGMNALVLGAGVSKNAGLPLWEGLLEEIFHSIKPKDVVDNFNAISRPCGQSSIIKAQYLSELISSPQKLSFKIKEVLTGKKYSYNVPLFNAIAKMVKSKRVQEVLTYNYDDLLEDALDLFLEKSDDYYTVYDNNQEPNDKMPIYHLHGYVPLNSKRNSIAPTPIISEKDYHQLYKHSFHWSNITLLHALNTKTCFFIGLSMLDPNMRRILDFYAEEHKNGKNQANNQHYVLLRKETLENATLSQNKKHWRILEQMYRRWKIKVIWFDDFPDLPDILTKIASNI